MVKKRDGENLEKLTTNPRHEGSVEIASDRHTCEEFDGGNPEEMWCCGKVQQEYWQKTLSPLGVPTT